MNARALRQVASLACLALALACGASEPREPGTGDAATASKAEPSARIDAELHFAPQPVRVGDELVVELVITAPPGHRIEPYVPPALPDGWLQAFEPQPLESDGRHSRQRVSMRVRPRALGLFVWPASEVVVTAPDAHRATLALAAREIEVIATTEATGPGSRTGVPYGLRGPPSESAGGAGFASGFAAGLAAMALALLGWRLWPRILARRRALDRSERERATRRRLAERMRREIAALRTLLESQPREASNRGAGLLRRYVRERFDVAAVSATTQELAATAPPRDAASRWSDFIRILGHFDDARFRPGRCADAASPSASREEIGRALEETEQFVIDSLREGSLR